MIEYLLFGTNILLIGSFGWYIHQTNKEKAKLINALIAKKPEDMVHMTLADQTTIKPEVGSDIKDSDLVPMEQLSDEEFDNHIAKQLNEVQ